MHVRMPTIDEVRELPVMLRMDIPAAWEDINGHVNVQHYLGLYDLSGWPMMDMIGIDEQRFRVHHAGMFDLEHHLWFLAEMHVGDVVTTHLRLLAQSVKRFHGLMFVVNETRSSLASALEFVTSGADLRTRRTSPLPDDVSLRLQQLIDEHSRLTWPAPRCGAITA